MLQNVIGGMQGIVDHAMVGHYVGFEGNAAIGVSWQIFLVVMVFCVGMKAILIHEHLDCVWISDFLEFGVNLFGVNVNEEVLQLEYIVHPARALECTLDGHPSTLFVEVEVLEKIRP